MKNFVILAGVCLLMVLSACSNSPKLKIEGKISEAKGQILYFERYGMSNTEILDSAKLNSEGSFRFKTELPNAPEFYRLRIGKRYIPFATDSATTIYLEANGNNFGEIYTIKGSKSSQRIKELLVMQRITLKSIDSLTTLFKTKVLTGMEYQKKLELLISFHRNQVTKRIYEDPRSPASYFALFERLHNYQILDPYNKSDNQSFAAVATAWEAFYPEALRTKNLVNLTLQGLAKIRKERNKKPLVIQDNNPISFFDIKLPNIYDKSISLSNLQGKVVLLDFTVYQSDFSPDRTIYLREVYKKYNKQGLEIYQVSLDSDENFWKTGAANLPWICVHDKNCEQSKFLRIYNVKSLPTYFLMDKEGNIVARDAMVKDLNKEIIKLL